jgi:hypothetical protein
VATHAVVAKKVGEQAPDVDAFGVALPETVTMSVVYPGGAGLASYFDTTISNGGVLDGTYDGWCVDTSRGISSNTNYTARVYSSYEPLPEGAVDYPQNLDLVNWVVNQEFSANGYSADEVQCAIWKLIDSDPETWAGAFTCGDGSAGDQKADAIVALALANGEGFKPLTCQDKVAVLLVPEQLVGGYQVTVAQVTIAEVGDFCEDAYDPEQTETAWGCGDKTFRTGWGSYFTCGGTNCVSPLPEVPAKLGRK